jgi:tellurite resistance protein TerC
MVLADIYPIPTLLSLAIIAIVLALAIVASVIRARRLPEKPVEPKEQSQPLPIESITPKQ